jgi:iron(II)-dependent oxidoreductase
VLRKIFVSAAAIALLAILAATPYAGQQAQKADAKGPKVGLMAFIPAGDFLMGREDNKYDLLNKFPRDKDDDRPVHKVYTDAFYMDKFETTNLEYFRFAEATGREKPWHWVNGEFPVNGAAKPVYNVSWFDADAYCKWLGKRLPTEAEFEKAARGGLELMYYPHGGKAFFRGGRRGAAAADDDPDVPSGDEDENQKPVDNAFEKFKDNPVVRKDVYRSTESIEPPAGVYNVPFGPEPIGTQKGNAYGLYDIVGNVWEWTSDWFGLIYYTESPYQNPKGPESGLHRVIRGGSWNDDADYLTVWFRNHTPPLTKSPTIGFRCACDAPASLKTKTALPE